MILLLHQNLNYLSFIGKLFLPLILLINLYLLFLLHPQLQMLLFRLIILRLIMIKEFMHYHLHHLHHHM